MYLHRPPQAQYSVTGTSPEWLPWMRQSARELNWIPQVLPFPRHDINRRLLLPAGRLQLNPMQSDGPFDSRDFLLRFRLSTVWLQSIRQDNTFPDYLPVLFVFFQIRNMLFFFFCIRVHKSRHLQSEYPLQRQVPHEYSWSLKHVLRLRYKPSLRWFHIFLPRHSLHHESFPQLFRHHESDRPTLHVYHALCLLRQLRGKVRLSYIRPFRQRILFRYPDRIPAPSSKHQSAHEVPLSLSNYRLHNPRMMHIPNRKTALI